MNIGLLRERITIERPGTPTRNTFGEVSPAWSVVLTAWASKETQDSSESDKAQQTVAESTHKFVMRYSALVTNSCRITHSNTHYNILSIVPDAKRTQLTILAKVQP